MTLICFQFTALLHFLSLILKSIQLENTIAYLILGSITAGIWSFSYNCLSRIADEQHTKHIQYMTLVND